MGQKNDGGVVLSSSSFCFAKIESLNDPLIEPLEAEPDAEKREGWKPSASRVAAHGALSRCGTRGAGAFVPLVEILIRTFARATPARYALCANSTPRAPPRNTLLAKKKGRARTSASVPGHTPAFSRCNEGPSAICGCWCR